MPSIRTCIDSNAVSSVTEKTQSTGYKVETVVGNSLAPLTSLLMPFTGPTDPVMHLGSLIGLAKAVCASRLGHLKPCVCYL